MDLACNYNNTFIMQTMMMWNVHQGSLNEVPINKIESLIRDFKSVLMIRVRGKVLRRLYDIHEQLSRREE